MREFGPAVGGNVRAEIMKLAKALYDEVPTKREVLAKDFAMEENPERIVVREVDLRSGDDRLRVAVTTPDARPPFEWLVEITSDIGEADYFRHYLIREHDVVLAQRKVLTPVDAVEADRIITDLQTAANWSE